LFLWLQSLSTYLASLFDTANTTGRSWHRHRCLHVFRVHRIFARRHVRGRVAPSLPVSSGVCRSHALGYLVFLGLAQSTRFHFLGSQGLSPSLRSKRAKICLRLRYLPLRIVVETFWTRLQDNLAQTIHRTLPVLLNPDSAVQS